MSFSTRNAYYLRVSNYRVIPLFLYLDERHVDWMKDPVLQRVIAELQPKMSELLYSARSEKKHKVHVERGEGYQYCYFLRTTTRTEVVLLKQKSFSLRPPTPPPPEPPVSQSPSKRRAASPSTRSRSAKTPRRSRTRSRSVTARPPDEGDSPPLQALDTDTAAAVADDGIKVKAEPEEYDSGVTESVEETNIKDWKPDVDVAYKGFGTSSVQLVLIIEPYPPLPPSQYAPPSSRLSSRSASIASSYSRSRSKQGTGATRYSSTSLSVALDGRNGGSSRSSSVHAPNMRNASRSVSAVPNSRRGGTGTATPSVTPFGREESSTPGPHSSGGRRRMSQTPLFMPRDTPFEEDEEDEEAHEAYEEALREGRLRLPSVSRPAGGDGSERGDDDDLDLDDVPESIMDIGERLVRNSQIEQGVVRVQGGWEERIDGEESAVMGKEEPGDY
ncbi:hypothetical protein CI109_102216 [Kwoniella shandongensis]|uniref:Uncharacterized protein n=1 Tax=Kwoniella shandongensis TaxID=1734106 RepID=A0A5M6C338_9TREE|nr:uncharacterized protein CI109_003630 [Kwoniella shandongensis]KAA5527975.1 hypothetical protein CI109_003630 [Kwoniella shandongensis]